MQFSRSVIRNSNISFYGGGSGIPRVASRNQQDLFIFVAKSNRLYKFDGNTWILLNSSFPYYYYNRLFWFDNYLFNVGSKTITLYNINTNSFSVVDLPFSSSSDPRADYHVPNLLSLIQVAPGKIYSIGGTSYSWVPNDLRWDGRDDIYEYSYSNSNPTTGTWTKKNNLIRRRMGASTVFYSGKIYVFSGLEMFRVTNIGQYIEDLYMYIEVYRP